MSERFRLAPRASVAELHGESVVLHLGSGRYFAANAAATTLLRRLATPTGASAEELASALVAAHGIERAQADADVEAWLGRLRAAGLLAPAPDGEGA